MKKSVFLILFVLLGLTTAWAYSFSAVAPTGQTLYYSITSSTSPYTVRVTYPGFYSPYWSGYTQPTGSLTIPSTVTYSGTTYSVTSIGDSAFHQCSGLTSVTIPNSVTSIGTAVFASDSSLTSVSIPNSVTSIGGGAFYQCSGLTSVTIPNSVTSIGQSVFSGCSGLTSLVVTSGNTVYDSRNNCNAIIETATNTLIAGTMNTIIPNSVTSIGGWAFFDCSGLTSVTIPNSVTSIGDGAFFGCSGLMSVTIPNSVTEIGWFAFFGCSGLTSVTIGNSVTSIGDGAFSDCSGLTEITSHPNVAPLLGTNVFSGVSRSIPVHIPCGSSMSYYSQWSYFSNFVENRAFTFSAVSSDEAMGSVAVLQQPICPVPNAVVQATPVSGYQFDRWSDGATQNPYFLTVIGDTLITAIFSALHSDTVYIHDTIIIHDTVGSVLTYHSITLMSSNLSRGMVAGNGQFPEGTEVEIAAVSIEGNRFVSWSDGSTEQIRTIVVDDEIVLTATFEPRDMEGINDVMGAAYEVTAEQGAIVVKDAMGEGVRVFDVLGRLRYQGRVETEVWRLGVSAAGTYFVQIAESPAQKVVVVR